MARARISSGRSPCYQGGPQRGLLRSVKKLPEFHRNLQQSAYSICLRATVFQIPEGTLWTYCICRLGDNGWISGVSNMKFSTNIHTSLY
jgi:hypothetical protein